jgi:hypothetical protein
MDQCRLISEDKGITFDLVKVSTSNSYVLVPDEKGQQEGNMQGQNEIHGEGNHEEQEENEKEEKGKDSTMNHHGLSVVGARLLRETDTFFIECIERKINLQPMIEKILKEFIYPTKGISIDDICERLMCSKKEIKIVLDQMKAFQIFSGTVEPNYGIVSEEMEREVWLVIRSVLSEWEGGSDYAGRGVVLQDIIREIMRQRNDDCESDLDEDVVRYCLNKCSLEVTNGWARLDADYVSTIYHYILCFHV